MEDNNNILDLYLDKSLDYIKTHLDFQKQNRKTVLLYVKQITKAINEIDSISDADALIKLLEDLKIILDTSYTNINLLKKILKEQNKIDIFDNNNIEQIKDYNNKYFDTLQNISKNNSKMQKFIQSVFTSFKLTLNLKEETKVLSANSSNNRQETLINKIENEKCGNSTKKLDNNVLLISEKEQKAFLPYKITDIEKKLAQTNKYTTMDEIINKEYTINLDMLKTPSFSRFKEAINLVRNKERGSLKYAFELGMELIFKYNLNPIIIRACRNLDELDIYLDCLDENELDKFKCFEIIYEVSPILKK